MQTDEQIEVVAVSKISFKEYFSEVKQFLKKKDFSFIPDEKSVKLNWELEIPAIKTASDFYEEWNIIH